MNTGSYTHTDPTIMADYLKKQKNREHQQEQKMFNAWKGIDIDSFIRDHLGITLKRESIHKITVNQMRNIYKELYLPKYYAKHLTRHDADALLTVAYKRKSSKTLCSVRQLRVFVSKGVRTDLDKYEADTILKMILCNQKLPLYVYKRLQGQSCPRVLFLETLTGHQVTGIGPVAEVPRANRLARLLGIGPENMTHLSNPDVITFLNALEDRGRAGKTNYKQAWKLQEQGLAYDIPYVEAVRVLQAQYHALTGK